MTEQGSAATTLLTYTGPTQINCPESCDVPEGVTLTLVPAPRHAWPDVVVCPNEGCGCAFLIEGKS